MALTRSSAGLDRTGGDNLNFSEVHVVGDQYRGDQLVASTASITAFNYYQESDQPGAVALTNLDVRALPSRFTVSIPT